MKTNILSIKTIVKKYMKYLCAVLMLFGMSAKVWGTASISPSISSKTIDIDGTYGSGNFSLTVSCSGLTNAYGNYLYVSTSKTTDDDTYLYNAEFGSVGSKTYSINSTSGTIYVSYELYEEGTYNFNLEIYGYEADTYDWYQVEVPVTINVEPACTKLGTASSLAVDTRFDDSGTEKVKFSWTRGSDVATHADNQKFCYWPIDGDATCSSALTKSNTSGTITRSSLTTGHYGWSIQALGSGDYCNSDAAESEFCIDDVDKARPGSWTGSTLSLTSKRIGWASISNAEYYIVNIINKSTSATIGAADRVINTNSIDITGLTANVTYTISVVAYNACDDASKTGSADFGITAYTVSFNLNGEGSNAPSNQQVVKNGKASTPSAPTPPTGKHFDGWYREAGCSNAWNFSSDVVTQDTTLYAKWSTNTHSLHWYKNADDADALTGTYTDGNAIEYGATVTAPNTPTRTGYTFAGWSETSSGSTTTPVTTMPDADKAYYAIWTAHTYSVHFDANHDDAEGSMDDQDFTYGVAQALTTCGFTNEGYFFKGWATTNDGDVAYTNGQSVSNLSSTNEAVVDLYAVWGTYEKYVFSCVDIEVGLEDSKKVLVTSRNGINIMAVNKLFVTTEGAVDGHIVDFSNEAGLKFYKKVDGVYKDLSVVANKLVTPLTNQEVYVSYAPTSAGTGAITIPEFTISCEGFTQTFNTSGEYIKVRNLPAAVAIVAKVGSTYHALTGNITSSTTPEDIMISASTVDGVLKANGPADLAYKLWPVKTTTGSADRFGTGSGTTTAFGDRIRLAGKSDKGLMANNNASSNKYNINNSATIDATDDDGAAPYEWKITTTESDGQFVYTLQTDQTNNTRKLRMYNGRWGTYLDEKGVEELYLLPLVTTTQADMEAYEWGTSELVVKYSPAATPVAFTSITAGETTIDASATTKMTRIGTSDLWRIQGLSGLSLVDKPAELLIIRVTENEVAKQALIQIPFLVSGNKSDYDLRSSVSNVEKVYKNTDVVILSGGKLTNSNLAGKFNDLYIYPGGKLIVESEKTMTISQLYMRGGYSYIGSKKWDVPRAKLDAGLTMDVDTFVYDLNMDADKYYDLAVPYPAKLGEATDDEGDGDFDVWLKIYDGDNRASNGKGWTWFNWAVATPTLQPGVGYLIEALPRYGRTYCTVRFPMKADLSSGEAHKTAIPVIAYGITDGEIDEGKTPNNVGWNFIANPYLCNFGVGESVENIDEDPDDILQIGELELGEDGKYTWNAEGAKNVRYVTTFDFETQHYEQHPLEGVVLAPFTGFFIQVGDDGTLDFKMTGRQLSAPALRNNSMPRDMEIAIKLAGNGQTDETRLHINDDLTIVNPLEFPEENTKQMNANYVNIYTYSDQVSMYANGLNYDESENWNDMGVVAPSDGEYTFSIKKVNRNYVNGVLILDKTTSVAYNLLDGDVTLQLPAGTINGRFAVKIQYGPATTTDFEGNGEAEHTNPEKFIYEDQMFIRCKGVLYDATGKKVRKEGK